MTSLLVLMLALACTPGPPADANKAPAGRYGGNLVVRLDRKPALINPLSEDRDGRKVTQLMFAGLMRLDGSLRPVADLAESWTPSADELTWTFKLRPGILWHDGTTLTSEDVLFSLHVLLDGPDIGDQILGVAQADLRQHVVGIDADGPYIVRVKLARRFAPLLADLAAPILPRHLLAGTDLNAIGTTPIKVGAGPFRLARESEQGPVLGAFQRYFGGRPYLDRVTFTVEPKETADRSIASARVLLTDLDAGKSTQLARNNAVRVLAYDELGYYYIGFNLRAGRPFAERAVRQAWVYALDKPGLVSDHLGNNAVPVWSTLPAYSWAVDSAIPRTGRDLERAKQLLDSAGWRVGQDGIRVKNGRRLSGALQVRDDEQDRVALAQAIARQVREAGIDVRAVPADFNSAMTGARRPPFDFDAMLMGWSSGVDPDDYYLFHSTQVPSVDHPNRLNYVGFQNETYDRLSLEARRAVDWDQRRDLYRQIQHLVAGELPYYPLWSQRYLWAVSSRVAGIHDPFSPTFWSDIKHWQLVD